MWGVKYDEEDCSYKFINSDWNMEDLKRCWINKAELPMEKDRCNNLPENILERFVENGTTGEVYIIDKVYEIRHPLTEEESLDFRYNCFNYMMNISRDREFCQNKTLNDGDYYDCIVRNNITVIADDVLFRYGGSSYLGIGYGAD
jgi:hypothetical protein